MSDMKFLVVGLGSMGKRRIRNLQYLGIKDIIGLDFRDDRREEANTKYGVNTFGDYDSALAANPDVFIISTPPDRHAEYALLAAKANKHFFTEADVLDDGMDELIEILASKDIVGAPSVTPIFRQSTKIIKSLLDEKKIGEIYSFSHYQGQYLPDWHPWEDISDFYVGKRETGACREMIPFELIWLTYLFGDVESVSAFKDKRSNFHVDIDDTYQLILRFKNGILANMMSDVVSRFPYNTIKIIGELGVISWDWMDKAVKVYLAENEEWEIIQQSEDKVKTDYLTSDDHYVEEIRHFIGAIEGKNKYFHDFKDNKKILKILYAAEKSSESGMHVRLDE